MDYLAYGCPPGAPRIRLGRFDTAALAFRFGERVCPTTLWKASGHDTPWLVGVIAYFRVSTDRQGRSGRGFEDRDALGVFDGSR
jgi:hypothetical protein